MIVESACRRRMMVGAGAVALILGSGFLALPAVGAGAAVPHCSTGQLRLRFVDSTAATGHRFIDYAFKNVGTSPCTLRGYPGARLLNKQGKVIESAQAQVGHWTISTVHTVTINPDKRAFFTFTWVDGGFCPGNAFTFYNLRVKPPKNTKGFQRSLGKTPTCDDSAKVSAVRAKLKL